MKKITVKKITVLMLAFLVFYLASLAMAATFNDLFQWTANRIGIKIDPAKPLPTVIKLSLKELQTFHPEPQSGKNTSRGLYDNKENFIYIAKEANEGVLVHEIVHYFQFNYRIRIPEDFWEMHAQLVESDYCEKFGLTMYRSKTLN